MNRSQIARDMRETVKPPARAGNETERRSDFHSAAKLLSGALLLPNESEMVGEQGQGMVSEFKLTPEEFTRLCDEFRLDSDDRGPSRVSFNALTETASIRMVPSFAHECVNPVFSAEFQIWKRALSAMDSDVNIHIFNAPTFAAFGGRWDKSVREPDLSVSLKVGEGEEEIVFVLEIGFSQSASSMKQIVDQWLLGSDTIRQVAVVNMQEHPAYRDPVVALTEEEFDALSFPQEVREIKNKDTDRLEADNALGPLLIKGLRFTGRMTATFELFECTSTGKVQRQRDSFRNVALPSFEEEKPIEIQVKKLNPALANTEHEQVLTIPLEMLRDELESAWRYLAVTRCQIAIRSRRSGNA